MHRSVHVARAWRQLLGLGALCLAATGANAGDNAPPIAPLSYQVRVLSNGLQVIALPSQVSPTVAVQVWYHVGSKNDPPGRSGFAHLFEHLMFKSTRHLRSEQFDRLTEDVGGTNNAFTNDDVTVFQDLVPSNHLEVLLWAEAERMSNLNVVQENFVSERAVVEEEYRQRILAEAYGRFADAIPGIAFQVHPYSRPTIGRIEDLDAAGLPDVVAFHDTYYRPDNATLVVAGDFDAHQLDAWVDRYFGRLTRPTSPIPVVDPREPAWTANRQQQVRAPNVPLPAVGLVWQAPPLTHADAPALRVAAALLGSGDSSRLTESLVYRQQLAGQVDFEADLRVGPSLLIASAVAAAGRSPEQLRQAMLHDVLALAQRPVSAAELAKVKLQLTTGALLTRQTPEGLAGAMGEAAVLGGNPARLNTDLAALQRVTAADVQRVMRRWIASTHRIDIDYLNQESP